MKQPHFDIFISYRRRVSGDKPEMLQLLLEESGFRGRVSFDKDNLDGRFDTELIKRIDGCRDFVMFIAKGTFDNINASDAEETERYRRICSLPEEEFRNYIDSLSQDTPIDFVRIELGRALWRARQGEDIKIIPIAPEETAEYDFSALTLPSDISDIKNYHAVFYSNSRVARFKDIRRELLKRLSSKPSRSRSRIAAIAVAVALVVSAVVGALWLRDKECYDNAILSYDGITNYCLTPPLPSFHASDAAKVRAEYDSLMTALSATDFPLNIPGSVTLAELRALNSIISKMVSIDGGEFMMGASGPGPLVHDRFELPAHKVAVEPFHIAKYELSRAEWAAITGATPPPADSANYPVTGISFDDTRALTDRLFDLTGLEFSLPTEQQWEYAARGGSRPDGTIFSGSGDPKAVAWYDETSGKTLHANDDPHDGHYCNGAELYNMSGNAAELTCSPFALYSASETPDKSAVTLRGGSYISPEREITVTARDPIACHERLSTAGVRLVINH